MFKDGLDANTPIYDSLAVGLGEFRAGQFVVPAAGGDGDSGGLTPHRIKSGLQRARRRMSRPFFLSSN